MGQNKKKPGPKQKIIWDDSAYFGKSPGLIGTKWIWQNHDRVEMKRPG